MRRGLRLPLLHGYAHPLPGISERLSADSSRPHDCEYTPCVHTLDMLVAILEKQTLSAVKCMIAVMERAITFIFVLKSRYRVCARASVCVCACVSATTGLFKQLWHFGLIMNRR